MIVATLAHPSGVPSTLLSSAAAACGGEVHWLDEPFAADLFVPGRSPGQTRAALSQYVHHVDVIVQPAASRGRRLFVADMDSTIVACECLDELADYAGQKAQVAEITARAMRGELDFAGALRARVALLSGLRATAIDRCLEERVRPAPGARTVMATLNAHAVRTVLVTGGFAEFAHPVAADLGFQSVHSNRLEITDGSLTGRVLEPILGAEAKRQVLLAEARALGLGAEAALAAGDGANDVPMLAAAAFGLAVHAKPAAVAAAAAQIIHGDLTIILYALGLPRAVWSVA